MKVHEWLRKEIGSHGIYLSNSLERKFKRQVELPADKTLPSPPWPTHSHEETKRAMEARGLGGTLKPTKHRLVYGWEIAEALEKLLLGTSSSACFEGRGTRFHTCIDTLKKAGL